MRVHISRKKTMLFKDAATNNHIAMQEKLKKMNINDAHHEWGHQGVDTTRYREVNGFEVGQKVETIRFMWSDQDEV